MAACAAALALLVLFLWGWFLTTSGTRVPGGDFEVRYRAAENWLAGRPVYARDPLAYANPPFFILVFVPFTLLPYALALALWQTLSAAAYLAALKLTLDAVGWRPRGGSLWTLLVLSCAALPPVVCLLVGQHSTLVLLSLAAGLRLAAHRPLAAGAALGGALIKPHFVVFPALWLLARGTYRAVLGLTLMAAAGAAVSLAMVGTAGMRGFFDVLAFFSARISASDYERSDMHTLNAALHQWLQSSPRAADLLYWLVLALAVPLLAWLWYASGVAAAWRTAPPERTGAQLAQGGPGERDLVAFAAAVVGGVLLVPYAHLYDLTVLAIPYLICAGLLAGRPSETAPVGMGSESRGAEELRRDRLRWCLATCLVLFYALPFINLLMQRQLTAYGLAVWLAVLVLLLLRQSGAGSGFGWAGQQKDGDGGRQGKQ